MTPQSSVFVMAPLRVDRADELRGLFESMNAAPGQADPANPLVPFEQFPEIHYARFVILKDETVGDIGAYGLPVPNYPICLAFLADFDGDADDFRQALAKRAGDGLRRIFSFCEGYTTEANLVDWMRDHETPAAAMYVNWRGRTVKQIHEENALRLAIQAYIHENASTFAVNTPRQTHAMLKQFVYRQAYEGRLSLTPPLPTPVGWWLANLLHLIWVPIALLILAPFLILFSPILIYELRRREKSDPVIAPRIDLAQEERLARLEDHDVTNQFTVMGSVKPGRFRRMMEAFILWVANYAARHIFNRGHLARVTTIHFARWVFINDKRRVVFASNYDGSLDSYMDDFINKVGWGLNLTFSVGIAYPRTRWIVLDGSKDEQTFKYVLRRHELPTEVWYKAYPGLTAHDLKRNTLIRQGLEKSRLSDQELREWVELL